MWFAESKSNEKLDLDFLRTRDVRQQLLNDSLRHAAGSAGSIVMISSNIPGSDKYRPGICRCLRDAIVSLEKIIDLKTTSIQSDLLGPFCLTLSSITPRKAKMAAIEIEMQYQHRRLLDVDVYSTDGHQVDRASLNLASRPCLMCNEPARECIILKHHSNRELLSQVDLLLQHWTSLPKFISPEKLANSLSLGALRELELTPKPGLVDCYNSGSHVDLSYEKMRISVDLLPLFFDDIIKCHQRQLSMQDFIQTGIAAEQRMSQAINSNAHKGFIFLSGITLMAACLCKGKLSKIRQTISAIAKNFFANFGSINSRSIYIEKHYGIRGIKAEIEQGLPSIFDHGWPKYREVLDAGWSTKHAEFYLMAILMQHVDDTTAVHRCGLSGLARLRQDGKVLQRCLENQQEDPEPMLIALNHDYCQLGLTMGGVADCMALTLALQETTG